jgi:hypothetical protein
MLIRDGAVQDRHATLDPAVAERARQVAWAKEQFARAKVVMKPGESPTNAERQAGVKLTPEQLESRLIKINPNLRFEVIPGKPLMKYLWRLTPEGREKICLYHNFPMPEFSIFDAKVEEIPDPNIGLLDRKDLPKHRWAGLEYDPDIHDVRGEGYVFEATSQPGLVRTLVPWHEVIRGWRTILAQCVSAGLFSPEAAERVFGTSDRKGWAAATGRIAPTADPF